MNRSKWDINKIEAKAVKFGTGSHIITPGGWTGKTVISMLETKWDEMRREKETKADDD
jgi:hypothetical protein